MFAIGRDTTSTDDDLSSVISSLPNMMVQCQKELTKRGQEIARERKALEEECVKFGASNGNDFDVMHLNVGGQRMDVLRRTLTMVEGSMLASRFSGRWDDNLEKDRDGNFFIDQNPKLFEPLIDYLRGKANETPDAPKVLPPSTERGVFLKDIDLFRAFFRMIEYYGVTHGVFGFRLDFFSETNVLPPDCPRFYQPGLRISSDLFHSVRLVAENHSLPVVSFDVVLEEDVTDFQVGWIYQSQKISNPPQRLGTFQNSIALDLNLRGYSCNGAFTNVDCQKL